MHNFIKSPLVSVIVPVYNTEMYLHKCIDSILNQSFANFELLLVDDGSTDDSGKICDKYAIADLRIQVVHKPNEGVSIARNVGVELAIGEYIIFVDSDDWVDVNFLELIVSDKSNADILYYGNKCQYENGNVVAYIPHAITCLQREDIEKEILQLKCNRENFKYYGYTWNKVFKNSIIKTYNIRFEPHLNRREDELFTSEYCRYIHSLSVIPEPIYNYRVLDTGLTSNNKKYDDTNKYRKILFKQIEYWTLNELKRYERVRYAAFLYQEAILDKNIFSCINKTLKAYDIVKQNSDKNYGRHMGMITRTPTFVGVIANLWIHIKNKFNYYEGR